MPSRDSIYKKVSFNEHMPIERTTASRSLAVIIEISEPARRNRADMSDLAMINFAHDLVRLRIMNEGWAPTEKNVQSIRFYLLPTLGEPARKEGGFTAWVVG